MEKHGYTMLPLPHTLKVHEMVSAYHVYRRPGFKFDGEYHNFWEVVCILGGKAGVAADDQIYLLEKGQIIFHRPMEFHRIWTEGNETAQLSIMAFSASGMERLEKKVMRLSIERMEELEQLIEQIPLAFCFDGSGITGLSGDALQEQIFCAQLELFLLHVLRDSSNFELPNKSQSAQNYNRIVRTLNDSVEKSLSLDELAQICGMSISNLKKTFHKYAGIGVMKYFTSLKMKRAIYLMEKGMTIAEISHTLAYANQNYFSMVFKRETGYAPSLYRKLHSSQ